MAVSQCIWTGRSGQDDLLKYKLASKCGRKVIEKTLKVTSVLVPGRLVWIFQKPVMYCNFPTHPSLQFKETVGTQIPLSGCSEVLWENDQTAWSWYTNNNSKIKFLQPGFFRSASGLQKLKGTPVTIVVS